MTENWIPSNWTFKSDDVAQRFDSHVRETLPWYDLATHGTAHLVKAYLPENGIVYDIGASTGNIGRSISDTLQARNATFIPIEPAEEMAKLYEGPGNLINKDATTITYQPFDVAILFLVLMFIPLAERGKLLATLEQNLKPGGAIIIVDKIEATNGYLGSTLTRWTLSQKQLGGITANEIIDKELALIGTQRPINPHALNPNYYCWLRIGEFTGYILTSNEHL